MTAAAFAYVERVATGDFSGAVSLIDRRTMEFYEQVRRDAVSLTAAELKARPLQDQVIIIQFRQGKGAASLRTRPIATLVAASIEPLVDPRYLRLKEIRVDGDLATVHVTLGELGGALPIELRREPEGWRLSLVSATRLAADRLIDGDDAESVRGFLAKHYGVDEETLCAPPQ
ncbi:MAG: hypothetical protein JNL21_29920 [Myxococcales bacterium]|nr:hypothetical protein [Myxococcales bacterium]